jgi:glutaconate CoA-transferase, subunit A
MSEMKDTALERRSKVRTLQEAFAAVKDGMKVSMTTTHYNSVPMASIRQLVRQRVKNLTIIPTPSTGLAIDLLVAAGCVGTVFASYVGLEFLGLAPNFRRAAEAKKIKIRESDEASLVMGYRAGASGIPFMAMPKYYELTGLPKANPESFKRITDPFTGDVCYAVPALQPDVAIIHVQECDPYGNARQLGGNHMEGIIAKAAKHLIITTEQVRPVEETRANPTRTTIPGIVVNSVVELPFGAHPGACPQRYNYDRAHLELYAQLAKDGRTDEYIKEFVFGVKDHGAYLDKIGAARLMALRSEY